MAGKTYVTKGYSTYTDIPAPRLGGYDHGQENPVNQKAVETKTIQRIRAPAAKFTDFVGSPSKVELLKEYVHSPTMSGSPKYATMNHYEDYKPNYENSSSPIKGNNVSTRMFSNPMHGYRSKESDMILSEPGLTRARHIRTGNIYNPNKSQQSAEESVYYSPRADPRQRGVLDDLSTRAQPLEPQRRYARPTFLSKPMDSHETMRRFRG